MKITDSRPASPTLVSWHDVSVGQVVEIISGKGDVGILYIKALGNVAVSLSNGVSWDNEGMICVGQKFNVVEAEIIIK